MIKLKKIDIVCKKYFIFKNLNLILYFNKIYILVGENGIGKSSFLKSFLKDENYQVKGEIFFNKINLLNYNTDYISRLGIFISNQNPLEIYNIKNIFLLKTCYNIFNYNKKIFFKIIKKYIKKLNFNKKLLFRNFNFNFSGGEKKKNEFLFLIIINPILILLDEIDSGLEYKTFFFIINYLNKIKNKKYIIFITHNININFFLKVDFYFIIKKNNLILKKCI